MRRFTTEIILGVVVFLAIVIFIFGYLYLKNVPLKANRYHILARFNDVTGLEKSDFVSVSGLRIGRVLNLNLDGLQVLVTLEINSDVKLPKDSRALIKSIGMVGEKYVEILPGTSTEYLTDGDIINGNNLGDLADMGQSMEGLVQKTEQLITELQNVLSNTFDASTQKDISRSFHHISNIAATLDEKSKENSEHLNKILANLEVISSNLNELVVQNRDRLEQSIDNFYQASNRIQVIVNKLDSSLTTMQSLLAKIENQEGALGKVINDDELYENIRGLTIKLDSLVQDLQKRPHKYFNLGFIKFF